MSEPNSGGWKGALLATGKPLERSVRDCVLELDGARPIGDFSFDRADSDGVWKRHSVDLRATWSDPGRDIHVDFLIESKYRRYPKTWIYSRSPAGAPGGVSSEYLFQSTDDLDPGRHFNRSRFSSEFDHVFDLGTEPFELTDPNKSGRPAPCDDGGRQLAYGVAALVAESAVDTLSDGQLRFVIPIAVTTASLRVLRGNPTLEEVKNATSLDDLSTEVPLIVSRFPAEDLEEHVLRRLHQIAKGAKGSTTSRLSGTGSLGPGGLAKSLSSKMDGTYLVVSYIRLAEALRNATSFCASQTTDQFLIRHIDPARAAVASISRVANGSS